MFININKYFKYLNKLIKLNMNFVPTIKNKIKITKIFLSYMNNNLPH